MDLSQAIYLDTETTRHKEMDGLPVEVIELAQKRPGQGYVRVQRFRPTFGMSFGAMNVHHILPADLDDKEPAETAGSQVLSAPYWIGHNIDFDWKALGSPPNVKRICTLAIARKIWPRLDSHKLGAVAYFLFGAIEQTKSMVVGAHSAAVDVELVAAVMEGMLGLQALSHLKTIEDLYVFSEDARVPEFWVFGKFEGQPIGNADRGYAQWYRKRPDPDPYLIIALQRAGLL